MKKLIVLIAFILSGCSFLNPLMDEHAFKEYADSFIGRNAKPFLDSQPLNENPESTNDIDDSHVEYVINHSYESKNSGKTYNCQWAITVEKKTNIVTSWRYVSEPSKCKAQYFYAGAW